MDLVPSPCLSFSPLRRRSPYHLIYKLIVHHNMLQYLHCGLQGKLVRPTPVCPAVHVHIWPGAHAYRRAPARYKTVWESTVVIPQLNNRSCDYTTQPPLQGERPRSRWVEGPMSP